MLLLQVWAIDWFLRSILVTGNHFVALENQTYSHYRSIGNWPEASTTNQYISSSYRGEGKLQESSRNLYLLTGFSTLIFPDFLLQRDSFVGRDLILLSKRVKKKNQSSTNQSINTIETNRRPPTTTSISQFSIILIKGKNSFFFESGKSYREQRKTDIFPLSLCSISRSLSFSLLSKKKKNRWGREERKDCKGLKIKVRKG